MLNVSGHVSSRSDPWTFGGMPALVAHRGFARRFPENTLVSLAAAVDAGAAYVEFDLQLSKDQVPFLMHDDNFRRTSGCEQSVFDLNIAAIQDLCVGEPERLGGRFQHVRPITLRSLCHHLNAWPSVHPFIEVKRHSVQHFGLQTAMARIKTALLDLHIPFTLISFRQDVVEYAQQNGIDSTGWVLRDWNAESLDILHKLAPQFVFCNYKKIPHAIDLPHGPWAWVLYEITDGQTASKWRDRGAHMIESMAVSSMLNAPPFAVTQEHNS
ncbi:MAG: glycerophosphodiester phosphodiesterase [Gammaproteobacteria bacterium]|nr:glycerophosphodiester phosphodiesterase [Gammaproteobacteria bacterium]